MNLLQVRPLSAPELWTAAFAIAVVVAVGTRWIFTLAGSGEAPPSPDLARFQALKPYLVARPQLTEPPRLSSAAAWTNPFDSPRYATARPSGPSAGTPVGHLSAILISQDRRLAIIGERILAVGDPLPGVGRVEAIEPDRVIISRNGRREILRLVPETLNR